ncbi:universal stress protein [Sanyastnella coralliicola]|uniref:universal stress protein n=1 Tax=Sanyastnella coralliicola TaxID=3069118 RepID=UPI0027BA6CBC|nr:universal stress protein [Longitalea sp. SCSIO 12813]
MSKKILVPTDFTKVGDTALNHAITVGKAIDAEVNVLHVIENKKFISEARLKLETLADRVKQESGFEINTIVRIGSIFEDIDDVATEMGASMIIMGTHGMKGMQFITGSRALRIVTDSTIPFIVVQEKGIREGGYDDIVVPLDLHKETKQKLSLVADMAKYFNSRVHLISPGETDEFLKNQLDRNITYAKGFLSEREIEFDVEISESKSSGFAKAVVKYASSIDADLITIMNFYENSLISIIGGGYEQQMITNEAQIPVMCLNPKDSYVMSGSVFSG